MAKTKDESKKTVSVSPETHKKLKVIAAKKGVTVKKLLEETVDKID